MLLSVPRSVDRLRLHSQVGWLVVAGVGIAVIHIASVPLSNHALFFHETTSLVAAGSIRNLFRLAVVVTVLLGVVPRHGSLPATTKLTKLGGHELLVANGLGGAGL
jgi:hypothetical protein